MREVPLFPCYIQVQGIATSTSILEFWLGFRPPSPCRPSVAAAACRGRFCAGLLFCFYCFFSRGCSPPPLWPSFWPSFSWVVRAVILCAPPVALGVCTSMIALLTLITFFAVFWGVMDVIRVLFSWQNSVVLGYNLGARVLCMFMPQIISLFILYTARSP